MNTQYFRVTAYYPTENFSVIMDNYGMHEKLWQLSSDLIKKGFKIIEVSDATKFLDVNITRAELDANKFILRAQASGEPERIIHLLDGVEHHAIKVDGKIYIPDKDKIKGGQ
jgi:hypothetical protein